MNYKKLLAFALATIMMSQMTVNTFANEDNKDIQTPDKPIEAVLDSTPRQYVRYFSFLPDENAPAWCEFDISIKSGTAWWQARIREGIDNWNATATEAYITENASSRNTANVSAFSDSWVGLYQGFKTASGDFTRFNINLNTRTLPANNINYVQSTATHELGHALHLADNPREDIPDVSLMNHARNRNKIYKPTSHDIESVNYYYDFFKSAKKTEPKTGNDEMSVLIADYIEYSDTQDMINDADIIVKCQVLDIPKEKFLNVGLEEELPYTVSTVEVSETFKGEVKSGDKLEIKQLGGETIKVKDAVYLENGEYLLLLKSYEDYPYSMINPIQGQYLVEDSQFIGIGGNKLSMPRSLLA